MPYDEDSLLGGLGPQREGMGGLLGSLDSKMPYLAMIAKGLNPWSELDPMAMMKMAQVQKEHELNRKLQQQRIGFEERGIKLREEEALERRNENKYITRADGSVISVPKTGNGFTEIAPGIKDLDVTALQKNYNLAVKQGFQGTILDYEKQMKEAGVPEKSYDSEMGKKLATEQTEIQKGGFNAAPQIAQLNKMEQLMDTPGFRTGTAAGYQQTMKKALVLFGGDPNAPAAAEAFTAIANKSVIDDLGGLGTAISNADRDYVSGAVASADKTPEGNRTIIEVKRKLLERKQDMARLARDYAKDHGGRLDVGFYEVAASFADKNPLFEKRAAAPASSGKIGPGNYQWTPDKGLH
jgi:hypothetical protein